MGSCGIALDHTPSPPGKRYDGNYDNFVNLSREIMRGRNTAQQRETVAAVLGSLLPPDAPATFRKLFPFNRATAEFNAWLTTIFFTWLVGPSELKDIEVEYEGSKETWRSGVQIKKCRYLEASGCTGLCVNLCKVCIRGCLWQGGGYHPTTGANARFFHRKLWLAADDAAQF